MPINSIGSILVIDDRQGSVSYIPNMLPQKTGKNIRYPYCNTSIVYKTIPIRPKYCTDIFFQMMYVSKIP